MVSEIKTCVRCSQPFEIEGGDGIFSAALFAMSTHCPICLPIMFAENEIKRKEQEEAELAERWSRICPSAYQETDIGHPGIATVFREALEAWRPHQGLGLISSSGKGKTRVLFMALKRAFLKGLWVHSISHNAFRRTAIDAFSGEGENRRTARASLDMMARVDLLLFDDLGKAPSTEGVDAELEELVERRTNSKQPILWSANGSGQWLIKRFGSDRGEPLVRRLAEFTTVVSA